MAETHRYPLMKNRISAVVNAPTWSEDHESERIFRPAPPAIELSPDGKFNYEKLEGDLNEYANRLRMYFNEFFPKVAGSDEHDTLNEKSFNAHLAIMKLYFEELYKFEGFRDLLGDKPKEFLFMLVDLHDFARYIMNGEYPLEYTERVSDGVEKWVIGKIFGDKKYVEEFAPYFHTYGWITEERDAPDPATASNPEKIALILKAIDTVSKGVDGQLIDPNEIFSGGGSFDRWLGKQVELKRFPIQAYRIDSSSCRVEKWEVSAQDYRKGDERLTNSGIRLIEEVIEVPFDNIFWRVKLKTEKMHLFNH